jgi:hypothetical protein
VAGRFAVNLSPFSTASSGWTGPYAESVNHYSPGLARSSPGCAGAPDYHPNVSHLPSVRTFRSASFQARNPINSRGVFCRHLICAVARRHPLNKEGPLKSAALFPDVAGREARAPKRPHTWGGGNMSVHPWEGRARTAFFNRGIDCGASERLAQACPGRAAFRLTAADEPG